MTTWTSELIAARRFDERGIAVGTDAFDGLGAARGNEVLECFFSGLG